MAYTYTMQDCLFNLPPELVRGRDLTVNMLKFSDHHLNLIVGRGILEADDENLETYFQRQLLILKRQVAMYQEIAHQSITVGVNKDIPAIEVQSRFEKSDILVCQFQLAFQIPGTRKTLGFTYSKNNALSTEDGQFWETIKQSIRLPVYA